MKKNESGFTMIVLLVTLLIIMLLFVYTLNSVYWKPQSSNSPDSADAENGNTAPNLKNPQSQVDSARERINEIQDKQNRQMEDIINQK